MLCGISGLTPGNCQRILLSVLMLAAALVAQQGEGGRRVAIASPERPERAGSREPGLENLTPDWFQHPERKDFAWDVRVFPPALTYRQRQLVQIEVSFHGGALRKAGLTAGDLFLVLKFGRQSGQWLPGYALRHFEIPPKLNASDLVQVNFGIYVEPGAYKASLIGFERRTGKENLWHGAVRVRPVDREPLAGSDEDIPEVEFLPAPPPVPAAHAAMMSRDPWEFGQGERTFPMANEVPVEVDLVANLSLSGSTNARHSEAPDWVYQINAAKVTEISRTISGMRLKDGCVRFSALDIPRQEIFADSVETRAYDWSRIHAAVQDRERNKIDVRTLAGEKKAPSFLSGYLAHLAGTSPGCTVRAERPPLRILIFLGDGITFPYGTEMTQAQPSHAWARCFYMEIVPATGPRWDQIRGVLKPLNPVRMEIPSPEVFRRVLVQLIHEIDRISANHVPSLPGKDRAFEPHSSHF